MTVNGVLKLGGMEPLTDELPPHAYRFPENGGADEIEGKPVSDDELTLAKQAFDNPDAYGRDVLNEGLTPQDQDVEPDTKSEGEPYYQLDPTAYLIARIVSAQIAAGLSPRTPEELIESAKKIEEFLFRD